MTWGGSSSGLPWARVAPFWLVLCFGLVQVPVSGQSTTSGPPLADGKPKIVTASTGTLLTLWDVLNVSKSRWESLQAESEALRSMLETGQARVSELSLLVGDLEKESAKLSESLKESLEREASLSQAATNRQKADQAAIDQARGQLWIWGGAGLGLGLLTGMVIGLIL